jgi:acyl carrier protein
MNTRERIKKEIEKIYMKENGNTINKIDINENMNLIEDFYFDSLKMMELVTSLEEEFNIEVDDDDLLAIGQGDVMDIFIIIEKLIAKGLHLHKLGE